MSNLSLSENQQSPFDSIKRTENDGTEYWLATELLAMLGYKSWKRQKETVDRAILSAKNSGENVDSHFAEMYKDVILGGNPKTTRKCLKDYYVSANGVEWIRRNIDLKKTTANRAEIPESVYRDILAKKLNGSVEVVTPVGIIDVLTKNEIIEVKVSKRWKDALGQILAYGHYYPKHQKRIHLTTFISTASLKDVISICNQFDVAVSLET